MVKMVKMVKPKRHKLIVEVTDMSCGHTGRRVLANIRNALSYGMRHAYYDINYENIQVKNAKKVTAAKKRKPKK